jgi:hypothetical protein
VSGQQVRCACPFGRDLPFAVTAGFPVRRDLQRQVEACDGVGHLGDHGSGCAHALGEELEAGDFFQRHQPPGTLVLESGDLDLEEAALQIYRGDPHRRAPRIEQPAAIAGHQPSQFPRDESGVRQGVGIRLIHLWLHLMRSVRRSRCVTLEDRRRPVEEW